MRRVLAVLGAIALLMSLPGGAAATKPIKETDHSRDAGCTGIPTPLGVTDFSGLVSSLYGADAWIDVWSGEPYSSPPVLTRDWDLPASVTFSGLAVSMSIPVIPSGVVSVAGTLVAADTIGWDDQFRDGNSWYRSSGNGTAYSFTGTLTLPGVQGPVAFGPDGCGGAQLDQSTFITQPHARVATFTSTSGECQLANADGDTGFIFGYSDGAILSIQGDATDSGGTQVGFYGDGEVVAGSTTISLQEYDPETGEPTGLMGTATVTAVDTGEAFSYSVRTSAGFERVRGTVVDIDGSISTSVGDFSLNACIAANAETKIVRAPSNGPKPGGKAPSNDQPSGAALVKAGSRSTVATKGAQVLREADYTCLQFPNRDGSIFEIPVLHTVWYKIAGIDGQITVDTAGSDYDTVLAVYTGSAGGPTAACVDDVPLTPFGRTLQASATFPTVKGTTYWVQIGGFDEATIRGSSIYKPYGTLKVAVR